jgi:hypothetical protein
MHDRIQQYFLNGTLLASTAVYETFIAPFEPLPMTMNGSCNGHRAMWPPPSVSKFQHNSLVETMSLLELCVNESQVGTNVPSGVASRPA